MPQNPGIGGLDELTPSEEAFIQHLAGLTLSQGDILYVNSSGLLTNLAAGTSGNFLKTQGPGANPVWAAGGGGSSGLTVGTTTITSGSTTNVLYNNAGVLGEYTVSGTGTVVALATAPTLTSPVINTGVSGTAFGTGVPTFLLTPSSANLASAITDETGTGALTFATSPTFTTSILAAANTANIGSTTTGWANLYMASGGVLNFGNGDVTITHSTGALAFGGSASVLATFTGTSGNNAVTVVGVTSGKAFVANSVTSGTGFQSTAISTGTGIDVAVTGAGLGVRVTTSNANAGTATAFYSTGTQTMASDVTASLILLDNTKTMTAAATRTVSANLLKIAPTYSITGTLASIYNLTGATATVARTISNASSSASSGLTVTGDVLVLSNTLGSNTNAVTDSSHILTLNQAYASASGDVLSIVNSGTGAYINAGSTAFVVSKAGHITLEGVTSTGATGTGKFVFDGTPTLVTPILGVATATSINKVTITAPATSSTLTIADGKTLTVSQTMTLTSGGTSSVITFPNATDTVGGLGTTQTWTSQNKFNNIIDVNNAVTVASNAGTVPITFRLNTFTNSSAATMAITMATSSAVDGQMTIVRIYDFSAAAQTIGWTNTEDSSVAAPTTSNGSTTLPLTVGFMFNGATSKWRCIAKA